MSFRLPVPPSLIRSPALRRHPQRPIRISSAAAAQFHAGAARYAEAANHYEILGLDLSASQADIKKKYYALSKSTHPDRNPDDPSAAARFSAVSDAYHVLGSADKRARYDRDVMRTRSSVSPRQGSHSSAQSGPYGARSASGLSKRKNPFRGPPRSFYESGGYGKYGDKRAADAERTAADAKRRTDQYDPYGGSASTGGGFSPGQGAARGFDNDVPHFDREGHYRTQESMQGRFSGRRTIKEEDIPYAGETSGGWSAFVIVTSVLAAALAVPSLFFSIGRRKNDRDGK